MQNALRPVPAPREPSIFGAMWRYRVVVAATVVLAVAAAIAYDVTRSNSYVAEASLIVQPPSATSTSQSLGAQDAARYTADQLPILRSHALRAAALEATRRALPGVAVTEDDFRRVGLVAAGDSDVITISYSASNPRLAATVANTVGQAYDGVRRAQIAATSAAAVTGINDEIAGINRRLGEISTELARLQSEPADDPSVLALSQEQKTLLDQRASLLEARSEASVATQSIGPASIFIPVDPSVAQVKSGLSRLLAVAIFLGLLLGAGFAYSLALRRRTFADAAEIELVVAAPMLGEVPDFSGGRRANGRLGLPPVGTPAAETFRLVASAMGSRAELAGAATLIVVSAKPNDGKTAVVANVAIAAATEGARVLVVDADSRHQTLSTLFEPPPVPPLDQTTRPSIDADVSVEGEVAISGNGHEPLNARPVKAFVMPTATLDLLSMVGSPSSNAWRSDAVRKYFQAARESYDLVLIDTPSLLAASDAIAIAVHADGAVVVVPEHSAVADVAEVVSRLRLVGTAPVGYVHNLASFKVRRRGRRHAGSDLLPGRRSRKPRA